MQRVPKYRPTLIDPYRDHLRRRRAEQPGVPVTQLLAEIRQLGYPGSANLLTRYLNQGRAEDKQQHLSPRRAACLLLTRPANLTDRQREHLDQIADACPEIAAVRSLVAAFAALLTPVQDNPARLQAWMDAARSSDLPHVHSFVRWLTQDLEAVRAALRTPHHNGRTEGVNTRTKMIKRQMYGRAGFKLLRHRILLG
jgi:transposase